MTKTETTRGPFRILLDNSPDGRNTYYEVEYLEGFRHRVEILFVGSSRVAFNNSIRRHGRNLLNITNLETGQQVVGGK